MFQRRALAFIHFMAHDVHDYDGAVSESPLMKIKAYTGYDGATEANIALLFAAKVTADRPDVQETALDRRTADQQAIPVIHLLVELTQRVWAGYQNSECALPIR
jgi:hypothetical protein